MEERLQALKTAHVKTLSRAGTQPNPAAVKLDLVTEHRDLPNPATYHFETDLEFPFTETLLPVAKRKLMRYLHSQGLAA
jgi:hypothetical protein